MAEKHVDELSGIETTGHVWDDDLRELNNPLPRWWLWIMYACIVWSFGYYIFYPSWPLVSDYTRGILGYSQRQAALDAYAAGVAARGEQATALKNASLEQIVADPAMLEFARAQGEAAFGDNCAPCHGTGATGGPGYPNLNDDDWIWGGSIDAIHTTIAYGIRGGNDNGRFGDMPAHADMMSAEDIGNVVAYVRSLSGLEAEGGTAAAGQQLFSDMGCVGCHGEDGKGMQELGAPNLTDAIWLYGSDTEALTETIAKGRAGVMPTWEARFNDDGVTVKTLAVYVHSLGGGQ